MTTTIYFLDKKSDDLPKQISNYEMYNIFRTSRSSDHYDNYKKDRSKLVRFAPLGNLNRSLDKLIINSCNEIKYFWDGDYYVKYDGPFVDFDSKENCYHLTDVKYKVYISYEDKPDGKKYVGSFTHKEGINDDYLGSYTDTEFKPDKRIDVYECVTRKEAYEKERELQISLDVVNNPIYVNKVIVEEQS